MRFVVFRLMFLSFYYVIGNEKGRVETFSLLMASGEGVTVR